MWEIFWLPLFFLISVIFWFPKQCRNLGIVYKLAVTIEIVNSCGYLLPKVNQWQHQEPAPRRTDEAVTLPGTIEHQQSRPPAVALADQNQLPTDNRS